MAALNQQGTSTPVGVITPDFIGQDFIDTTNNLVYISYGTANTDWQEVGAGGGGFGLNAGSFIELNNISLTHTWNIEDDGPLVARIDGGATAAITLDATNEVTGNSIIHNKLVVMVGETAVAGAVPITFNVSSALVTLNIAFAYTDSFVGGTSTYNTAKILSAQHKMITFDVTYYNQPPNVLSASVLGILILTKTGEAALTVDNGGGG